MSSIEVVLLSNPAPKQSSEAGLLSGHPKLSCEFARAPRLYAADPFPGTIYALLVMIYAREAA